MKNLCRIILFIFSINIYSHEFNPAHLIIDQSSINENLYEATWLYPVKNIGIRGNVIFPDICDIQGTSPFVDGKYIVEKITLDCNTSLKGKSIEIINLSVLTDALITVNYANSSTYEGLVNNKEPIIIIPDEVSYYPTAYLYLGVDHLLVSAKTNENISKIFHNIANQIKFDDMHISDNTRKPKIHISKAIENNSSRYCCY